MKRPSNEARDAMVKVATQFGVTRKKEGQIRKTEDVAEDLEVRMCICRNISAQDLFFAQRVLA